MYMGKKLLVFTFFWLALNCPANILTAVETLSEAEITKMADDSLSRLSKLMEGIEQNDAATLREKLSLLQSVRAEIGEENLLRFQIIEEFRPIRYGLQALGSGQMSDSPEKRITALKRILARLPRKKANQKK